MLAGMQCTFKAITDLLYILNILCYMSYTVYYTICTVYAVYIKSKVNYTHVSR